MTVTRDIMDNGKHIVHIVYSDEDIENAIKNMQQRKDSERDMIADDSEKQ